LQKSNATDEIALIADKVVLKVKQKTGIRKNINCGNRFTTAVLICFILSSCCANFSVNFLLDLAAIPNESATCLFGGIFNESCVDAVNRVSFEGPLVNFTIFTSMVLSMKKRIKLMKT